MSRSQRHHTSIWLNDGSVWSLETFQGICDFSLLVRDNTLGSKVIDVTYVPFLICL